MSKRIVICSDGTWFTPEHRSKGVVTPSNVYKMACAVKPRAGDDKAQIVLYNKGVGTGGIWDRFAGGAFGRGLFKNIEDVYFFLVHNYTPGDEIYLFGFSRGAYTVRSTAGLIRKCGLLHKIHADKFGDAYKLYRRRDATPDTPEAINFREDNAQTTCGRLHWAKTQWNLFMRALLSVSMMRTSATVREICTTMRL
jgi:uncharacterized protein (DUF2235 family)